MRIIKNLAAMCAITSFAGCSTLIPTPTDQAAQIDFGTVYMESLSAKYKPNGDSKLPELSEKLARYDRLSTFDSDEEQKKIDSIRKADISEKIRNILYEVARLDGEHSYEKSLKSIEDQHVDTLTKQLADLIKRPSASESQLKSITTAIDNHRRKSLEINALLIKLESERVNSSSAIEEYRAELKILQSKVYNTSEISRMIIRDQIIRDFIAIADHNYMYFKNELLSGRARSDTIADISELLLSTATTLTGGVMAKTNLGAASTLLKGSRSTVDKNFFAQQTMRAIINAMEQGRATDKKIIVEKMATPTTKYPLSEAISDVQRYQSRASLFLAVLDLANQSGNTAVKAESDLNDAVKDSAKPQVK